MNLYNFKKIKNITSLPTKDESIEDWLLLKGLISFLEEELEDDYILLYASSTHSFLQTALIPSIEYTKEEMKDLLRWSGGIDSSWSFSCSYTDCNVESPSSAFDSNVIATGEPILHSRSFEGMKGYESYFEINQKIAQVLELHYIHDKRSWCKLDKIGGLDEVIMTLEIELNPKDKLNAVVIKKEALSQYTTATNQLLLRMVDFSNYNPSTFTSWNGERRTKIISTKVSFGEQTIILPIGSFFRGIQLVDISMPMDKLVKIVWGNDEKEYVDLIINDFKHNKICTHSCNPNELDSYFEDTGKPFATSPAFFDAEVLRKYKSDSEKFTVRSRSIECRGAWYLRSYDINDAGQVSIYLCDLSKLPYREQLHWKQYNVEPKTSISKRAFENDFLGKFSDEDDVLEKLKRLLSKMNDSSLDWWKLKTSEGLTKLHYPYTDSKDEWADELLNFDQVIVEGFDKKSLKAKANELSVHVENKFGTLKIIENILIAKGFEIEDAHSLMSVFHEVHNLRNKVKGHVSGSEAEDLRKKALKDHGSYNNHFKQLFEKVLESLKVLLDEIK
ncbi:hypothetical protein [Psychrobacter sp. DAB_AL43B]|uniref:hypothetical protein n=1 Tax=Psychrobacter sp. DAB_AL43B TaxID=1028416 RepID=UPI0009A58881|nr:hypothetical protein [Psychrobacter sp. DAB_AL43B]SLJ83455.1 hypothetical protein DABAL43B_0237 [Psychrobacter sp. DAB_AL43B]